MKSNKRNHNDRPVPALMPTDANRVLASRNIRWRHKDFCVLHDHWKGCSERDINAYVRIGEHLYAVRREVFFGYPDGELRVFLGEAPVLLDLRDAVDAELQAGAPIEVTPALQKAIVAKAEAAWHAVIAYCVEALRKAPGEWTLERLMRHLEPVSLANRYVSSGIDKGICRAMGLTPFSDKSHVVCAVMGREQVLLPNWIGTDEVQCHVYMLDNVERRDWVKTKKGVYTPWGNLRTKLRLDRGPLAVVTAASENVFDACEDLITRKTYGDLVLLIGEGEALQREAKRLSDYLLGVDILSM